VRRVSLVACVTRPPGAAPHDCEPGRRARYQPDSEPIQILDKRTCQGHPTHRGAPSDQNWRSRHSARQPAFRKCRRACHPSLLPPETWYIRIFRSSTTLAQSKNPLSHADTPLPSAPKAQRAKLRLHWLVRVWIEPITIAVATLQPLNGPAAGPAQGELVGTRVVPDHEDSPLTTWSSTNSDRQWSQA